MHLEHNATTASLGGTLLQVWQVNVLNAHVANIREQIASASALNVPRVISNTIPGARRVTIVKLDLSPQPRLHLNALLAAPGSLPERIG